MGGFYAEDINAPTYHFSFCSDTPNPDTIEFCNSADIAVCAVVNGVGVGIGYFADMKFTDNVDHKKGFSISYSAPKEASACINGTTATFVMNCSRNFNPETNYTVTSAVLDETGCSITFNVNTVAACPIYVVETETPHRPNWRSVNAILMIAGIVSLVVLVCSCCVLCCVCRKVARERCARNKGVCQKKATPAAAPKAPVAAVAPRQPQPPVTPPPQQFPGYFVPAPQGMAPMYPNLYQGGYMPLVPMMQQPHMPAHNPFAQVNNVNVAQRSQQEAEDERLARALQAQFNQEQA